MAQLKDSVVSGNLRVSDTTLSATVQLTTLRAPTTAGGTTYGPGTSGQVLKTNGTSSYWGVVDTIGSSTVGGTYLPIYLNAGTPTAITVKNNTAKSAIGWASGAAANASLVTLNSIAYWNGCYSGTSSNLEYCAKGAFGTIVTKSTTDYSKVSISRDLTSGTKIGTITIDGTSTDLYCQTNTNTDTKVTQTASSTSDFRPIVLGYTHSTTPGDLAPSTAPTDQVYVTTKLYMQPTSGDMYSAGTIILTTTGRGLKLTDSDGNAYAGIWDNGHNLWIGATQAATTHHVGQTFISSGYDSANSIGYDTIRVSVPNATNDGATNYYALHDGNTSASASIASTETGAYQIGTVTIRNSTTTFYGVNTNTWTAMVGATSSANGTAGYVGVNPPKDGYNTKFWRADGSWAVPTNTTYGLSGAYGGTGNSTWVTTLTAGGSGTTSTVPTASTSVYGITKLSDSTSSTSTALAATANAVKTAYDLADGKSVVTASTSTVSGATTIKSIKIDNTNYNIYDSGNTDTKVNVKLATTTKAYLLATSTTPTSSDQAVTSLADTGVYLSTTAGEIVATNFSGKINNHTVGADVPSTAVFTDANVTQTELALDASYEVLFAGTADSTTRTEGVGKSSAVTLNPSSGNLTTTGAFVLKEGSYLGTIDQNTLTADRTWTFPKHASGIIHIEQRANFYDDTTGVTSTPWQKVASLTTGAASTDRTATFIVASNYSGDVEKKFGILQCHFRTNGSKVFSSGELVWLYKSPGMFLSDVVMCYKGTSNTTVEIWAKSVRRYSGYTFTLLDEHDRKGVISGQWELTTNNGATGSASLPSGFTSKDSRILSNGTTLFDGTVSASTVPDPSIPLQYAITNADYDWQSFSMLIMCIQTGNSGGIDEWTNIVIPWQLFCSDVTTGYYIPKGISDLSSAAALQPHPTNPGQGILIDVTRGSWSGSKRVVFIGIQ